MAGWAAAAFAPIAETGTGFGSAYTRGRLRHSIYDDITKKVGLTNMHIIVTEALIVYN